MKESYIETRFIWYVEMDGGTTWKFKSPGRPGVSDRIAWLRNGDAWFVELKTKGGRMSAAQKAFRDEALRCKQNYACLWTIEQVEKWALENLKN